MYSIQLQQFPSISNDEKINVTNSSSVQFSGLQPATLYTVAIAPVILGAVIDPFISFAQTLDDG